jgi:membrane fusion protein, multidrug efflux system
MMSTEEPADVGNGQRRRTAVLIFTGVVALALCGGYLYVRHQRTFVSTDDAFVDGTVHMIAPRVGGAVLRIAVDDNVAVRTGDLLVDLDPEPFEVALTEAEAGLEAVRRAADAAKAALEEARAATGRLDAAVVARDAERMAKAALCTKAEADRDRARRLYPKGVISKDGVEQAETSAAAAAAALRAAEALLTEAKAARVAHDAAIAGAEAAARRSEGEIDRALAAVRHARLQLSYARVVAPANGLVTKKSVEVGDVVAPGRPLMALVPTEGLYVVANYKETNTTHIRPGLAVRIEVDGIPGRTYRGRVDSLMAGTGAAFSLFPPENATGNYVKVVQRIPVKIVFEPDQSLDGLRLGMSVVPTILLK